METCLQNKVKKGKEKSKDLIQAGKDQERLISGKRRFLTHSE